MYRLLLPLAWTFVHSIGMSLAQTAGDYRTLVSGNWSAVATWQVYNGTAWTGASEYPGQNSTSGNVNIRNAHAIMLDVDPLYAVGSISIGNTTGNTANTSLVFSGSRSLNISGSINYIGTNAGTWDLLIDVGTGTCNTGSVSMFNSNNNLRRCFLNLSTGLISSAGNIAMPGSTLRNQVTFNGGGLLRIGGSLTGGALVQSNGTVEFLSSTTATINGYTFYNLRISGTGNFSSAGNITVQNNLEHLTGTLSLGANAITVLTSTLINGDLTVANGNVSLFGPIVINGSFTCSSNGGTKSFSGDMTINGTFNNGGNVPISFGGNLANNGTFVSGTPAYTFSGIGKTISGSSSYLFNSDVTVNGTYTLGNSANISIGRDLLGTGVLILDSNSAIGISRHGSITILLANGYGSTVQYSSNANQNVKGAEYHNLVLAGGGTKTLRGIVTVNGSLTVNSGVTLGLNLNHITVKDVTYLNGRIQGNTNNFTSIVRLEQLIMDGGNFSLGTFIHDSLHVNKDLTVLGGGATFSGGAVNTYDTTYVNGTLTVSSNQGNYNFFGNVSVNPGGSWISTAVTSPQNLEFSGGIEMNGTQFSAAGGTFNFNNQTLAGISPITFSGGVTLNHTITVTNRLNAILSIGGNLDGTAATWKNDTNSTLHYQGVNAPMQNGNLDASAIGNTIRYDRNGAQSIKGATYYNMITSGNNATKTAQGDVTVINNLQISASTTYATNRYATTALGSTTLAGTYNFTTDTSSAIFNNINFLGGTLTGSITGFAHIDSMNISSTGGIIGRCDLQVYRKADILGTLTMNNATGTKIFHCAPNIQSGGSWVSTAINVNDRLNFYGGIISNGNSFSAGAATFSTNNQSIDGTTPLSFANSVNVSAISLTNNTTVTMSNNGASILNGTGTWEQGISSVLNFRGSSLAINSIVASANGNTVNYSNAGNQTIAVPNASQYYHLNISSSGTKTLSGAVEVLGDLNILNTAIFSAGASNAASYPISIKGNWNNSSTNGDPFTERIQTVQFTGDNQQQINNTGNANGSVFYGLHINNTVPAGGIMLNCPAVVNGPLSLTDGHVLTDATNILRCGAASVITLNATPQDSSFIKGPMAHTVNNSTPNVKVFPIGKNNNFRRIDVNIQQTSNTNTFYTAEMIDSSAVDLGYALPATIDHVSDMRYYRITQSAATGLAANAQRIRIYYQCTEQDDGVLDPASLLVAQHNGSGFWLDRGGNPGASFTCNNSYSGTVQSNGFSTFSGNIFSLASPPGINNPLPVQMIDFSLNAENNMVNVSWVTASEINSDYFTIERSADGNEFHAIKQVDGAGTSSSINNYSFTDAEPFNGISFYRLIQTDYDGQQKFYEPKTVRLPEKFDILIYPNPVHDWLTILLSSLFDGQIKFRISDMTGRTYLTGSFESHRENEKHTIDLSSLSEGMYFISIQAGDAIIVEKLLFKSR